MEIKIQAARSSDGEVVLRMPAYMATDLLDVITLSELDVATALEPIAEALVAIGFEYDAGVTYYTVAEESK